MAIDALGITDTQIATLSGPLSVNGVASRRAKAPKMSGGIAAHASSDMFKSPVRLQSSYSVARLFSDIIQGYGKPRAKRWDRRLIHLFSASHDSVLNL